jgi:hypothetical protein
MSEVTYPGQDASRDERRNWARQILRHRAHWETAASGEALLEEAEAVLAEANREEEFRYAGLGAV